MSSKQRNGFAPLPEERNITITLTLSESIWRTTAAALSEMRDKVGTALMQPHAFHEDAALTRAAAGLGALCGQLYTAVPRRDTNYPGVK
jgi:hypothetical protein